MNITTLDIAYISVYTNNMEIRIREVDPKIYKRLKIMAAKLGISNESMYMLALSGGLDLIEDDYVEEADIENDFD